MKREFGIITALLVLTAALCAGSTVVCKEKRDYTQENERYAQLEDAFRETAARTLAQQGYPDSGLTVTWTRDREGRRSYQIAIHHRRILASDAEEQARLTEMLCDGDFCKEIDDLCIVYR